MSQGFCTYFKLFVRNCKGRECFKAVWFQKIYIGHFRWNRITGSNNWQLRCAVELLKKRCYDTFSYPALGWLPDSRIERIFKLWCCGKFRLKIHISWKRPAKGNLFIAQRALHLAHLAAGIGDWFGNSSHGNRWEKPAFSLLKFVVF